MAYVAPNGLSVDFLWGSGVYAAPSGLSVDFQWPATESVLNAAGVSAIAFTGRVVAQGALSSTSSATVSGSDGSSLESSAFVESYSEFSPVASISIGVAVRVYGSSTVSAVADYPFEFHLDGRAAAHFAGSATTVSSYSIPAGSSAQWVRYGQVVGSNIAVVGETTLSVTMDRVFGNVVAVSGTSSVIARGQAIRQAALTVSGISAANFQPYTEPFSALDTEFLIVRREERQHVVQREE